MRLVPRSGLEPLRDCSHMHLNYGTRNGEGPVFIGNCELLTTRRVTLYVHQEDDGRSVSSFAAR